MGPTASGKTDIAVELASRFPLDIVSVDSALVYRGMDVGTAKPDAETLARVPHRLVDIRDPEDSYSAGDFVRDAREAMEAIFDAGRVPLLVGGTMMYFRALIAGMAELPGADPALRAVIDEQAALAGWPALHAELERVDPESAARIEPNDRQRIQRALEVYRLSGRPMSAWHEDTVAPADDIEFAKFALLIPDRAVLHQRIEYRLDMMFAHGFLQEVRGLRHRPGLTRESPSMRAVGYRQVWTHLAGETSLEEAKYRALVATRQLAKRQITWLRSEPGLTCHNPLESATTDAISAEIAGLRG